MALIISDPISYRESTKLTELSSVAYSVHTQQIN